MKDVLVIILLILSGLAMGALIVLILDVRKSLKRLDDFMGKTEEALIPTMNELRATLSNVKEITEEVNGMTADIRKVTSSVSQISGEIGQIAGLLEAVSVKTRANIGGIRAGLQAAFWVLKKNLFGKGDSK